MLKLLSKAFFGFAFLISVSNTYANYKPSRETVRYIFLFYESLTTQSQITTSLSSRIAKNINRHGCINPKNIQFIASKHKSPRNIITAISTHINKTCANVDVDYSKNDPAIDLSKYNLYILFSSEWSNNVESSFGHIRLALMKSDDIMFDPTFTFSAYDFYSYDNSSSSLLKYWKAAFTSVEGRFSENFFFDNYHNTVVQESRSIHRFRVNMNNESIKSLFNSILTSLNKPQDYNFFIKNCSTKSLDLITEFSNLPQIEEISPAKQLKKLIDQKTITYTDTFSPINSEQRELIFSSNNLNTIIYDKLSLISLGTNSLSVSLYKSPRPIDSSIQQFSMTSFLKFESEFDENIKSMTLIEHHTTSSIHIGKPSLKLKIGYNTENHLYSGIGFIHNNIGGDAMIGYSDTLGWSSFSSLNFKYQLIDFSIGLQSNRYKKNTSIDFGFYLTDRLSLVLSSINNSKDLTLNYIF
mgnify:CR=1 FL=1